MREFIHSFSFGCTVIILFWMLCLAASIIFSLIVIVIPFISDNEVYLVEFFTI